MTGRPPCSACLPPLAVPYPLLGENTLVLSDVLCVAPNEEGTPCLMCRRAASPGLLAGFVGCGAGQDTSVWKEAQRVPWWAGWGCPVSPPLPAAEPLQPTRAPAGWWRLLRRCPRPRPAHPPTPQHPVGCPPGTRCRAADTYPNQMLEITVRMYLYRWTQSTDGPTFSQHTLDVGGARRCWRCLLLPPPLPLPLPLLLLLSAPAAPAAACTAVVFLLLQPVFSPVSRHGRRRCFGLRTLHAAALAGD